MSAPRTLPVTPAEQHLAAILRSFQAWNTHPDAGIDEEDEALQLMLGLGEWLQEEGMLNDDEPGFTPAGAALLARVEAAPDADPTAAIVAFIRAEETKFRKAAASTGSNEAAERCAVRASVLATVAAYIERGDHLAPPIDAPPAKEPR